MNDLAAKVAVITGGCGGIGQAIAAAFAEAGARAIALDVQPAPPGVEAIHCDVCEEGSITDALAKVKQQCGRIDFAVYAAGISREAVVWKLAARDWDQIMAVNLRGAFLLLHHAVPLMRGAGGRIVLIGSINGSRGKFGTAAYSASKAGLIGLAKSVARETGRFGIAVNVVEPGWVRTPLTDALPADIREAAVRESVMGTLLDPGDIAHAVMFLCGPGGARITGQILRVDGGQYLGAY